MSNQHSVAVVKAPSETRKPASPPPIPYLPNDSVICKFRDEIQSGLSDKARPTDDFLILVKRSEVVPAAKALLRYLLHVLPPLVQGRDMENVAPLPLASDILQFGLTPSFLWTFFHPEINMFKAYVHAVYPETSA